MGLGKGVGKAIGKWAEKKYGQEPQFRMVQTGYNIVGADIDEEGNITNAESLRLKPQYKRVCVNAAERKPFTGRKGMTLWNYLFKTGFYSYRRNSD